jgi:hypothetical protein
MAVTVSPDEFALVDFDAVTIAALATQVVRAVGLPDDLDLTIEVDETTPLGRARVTSVEPAVVAVQSGAFEEPTAPRQFSERATADVLGRLLFRLGDRLAPAFGGPPADAELPLPHETAWDTYAAARLHRVGYPSQRQRRLYAFRTRHGFTDVADRAFQRLWTADDLTWSDIVALSDEAIAGGGPA